MNKCSIFLLVTDSVQGSFLEYHFKSGGFKDVMLFKDQDECMYRIRRNAVPEFIIADVTLKGMPAIEFLRLIKAEEPHVKVVFLSDHEDMTLMSALLEEGAADYIQRNGSNRDWIRELISNVQYLIREESGARLS